MNKENTEQYRYVIGTLGASWIDSIEKKSRGKLDVIIEEFRDESGIKQYAPINTKEHFCDTEKVFITGPFDELERKYEPHQLLLAEVTRANKSEGNQQSHIAYYKSVQLVKNTDLLEVLSAHGDFNPDEPILHLTHTPSTNLIMISTKIDNENFIQGPFSYDITEQGEDGYKVNLRYPATPLPGKKLGDHIIGKLGRELCKEQLIDVTFGQRPAIFLADITQFINKLTSKDHIDIMDSETLLRNYVEPLLKDSIFRSAGGRLTKKGIEVLRNNVKNGRQFKAELPRYQRTVDLLAEVAEFDSNITKLKDELLKMPEGQRFLEEFLEKNESAFYEKYRANHLQNIEQEANTKRIEIERLENKRQSLLEDLKSIAQQKSEKENEFRQMEEKKKADLEEQVMRELKRRHAELQNEISHREKLLSDLKSQYSEYKTYQELLDAIEQKRNDFRSFERIRQDSEDSLKNLKVQIKESSARLTEQFINIKAGFEAMTQSNKVSKTKWNFRASKVRRLDTSNKVKAQQEYLEELDKALRHYNRHLDTEQLVNLVTTLAQNQFTICSGLPGTGKTSLIKRLGQAMNLGYRQHTISVSRGWMSSNDILGYYNGLAGAYQPAATGLWELLLTMQEENPEEVPPSILLLDEMNLSSPEHYFSNFLDLADGESRREIFTGYPEKERLIIPNYIRFVGTVNSDETVQPLSPRMLDRAAVIPFDDVISDVRLGNISSKREIPIEPVSAIDWLSLFKGNGAQLSGETHSIMSEIITILEDDHEELGKRILISYRKRHLIADFVEVAGALLVEYEGQITALDRAILQHVLPGLNGYGDSFAERLKRLQSTLKKHGLNMSAKRLRKIILEGEEALNSYRYVV
ncbi:AAA family ATPase [Xenorhabdus entomophaga]|uniref:AAA family ATPase n=1 Tax=Xenorhabdus entomophaga TaxID=3136257 RepID=UPI0030F44C82